MPNTNIIITLVDAVKAGQEWIDSDRSTYEDNYLRAHKVGSFVIDSLKAGTYEDRKAVALVLNESWQLSDKGAETRVRRAVVIASANAKDVLAYDKEAGDSATITGLVTHLDTLGNGGGGVTLTAAEKKEAKTLADAMSKLLEGKSAKVRKEAWKLATAK